MIDLTVVPSALLVPVLEGNLRRLEKRHKVYHHVLEAVRMDLGADAAWFDRGPAGGERLVVGDERHCAFGLSQSLIDDAGRVGAGRTRSGTGGAGGLAVTATLPALASNATSSRAATALVSTVAALLPETGVAVPPNVLLQCVEVNGRLHGVLGAARDGAPFAIGQGRRLGRLAAVLEQDLERRNEERLTRVLDRIREKVVSALRPQDLAYQILDGLHQLVRYDHSAALLTWHEESGLFRVAAEKIVWAKAKSAFIGHEVKGSPELLAALRAQTAVRRLEPRGALAPSPAPNRSPAERVVDTTREAASDRTLSDLLDYYRGGGIPEVRDLLCAPLFFDGEFLGLLKIADHRGNAFDAHDARVVERFLPSAAVSLRNVRVKQELEDQAMQAEIRAGLVTLARAVAHDVNNAIGAILPLAEQAREDLREGRVDPQALAQDLDLVIDKAALCKRIFSNMLRVAGKRGGGGPVDLRSVIEEMMPMFESQTASSGVRLELDIPDGLPCVRFSKHHLERVLWNLVTNAIEAMGRRSGRVVIRGRRGSTDGVELSVVDDGPGIDPEHLAKVVEPFFTTKPNGTGLGLSLVRSLIWQNEGDLEIKSEPGSGTEVHIRLAGAGCGVEGGS
jgi:signal transduction histidine kinase